AHDSAYAFAGGLGADSDANDDGGARGVRIGYSDDTGKGDRAVTHVVLQDGALLTGNAVDVAALVERIYARDWAKSDAAALGADSDAGANIEVRGSAVVKLEDGAEVVGNSSLVVRAEYLNMDLRSEARAECSCGGGNADSYARIQISTSSQVLGMYGATVKTPSLVVRANAFVTRQERDASTYAPSPFTSTNDGDGQGGTSPDRWIFWETKTIGLGEPNPELEIDALGKIVKMVNVTLASGHTLGQTINTDINVNDIVYDRGATAIFSANNVGDRTGKMWGDRAVFEYQETWDYVRIVNYSGWNLTTNRIDVVNTVNGPSVAITVQEVYDNGTPVNLTGLSSSAPSTTFDFDIEHTFPPTLVSIVNLHPASGTQSGSTVTLDGSIENPIGTTVLTNVRGDIRSGTDTAVELVRTNVLTLSASGDAGCQEGCSRRIPLTFELVQYRSVDNVVHPIVVNATAGKDLVLDLTANRRSDTLASPAAGFPVTINLLQAGDDIDVVLNDSIEGEDLGTVGNVTVTLSPNSGSRSGSYRYEWYDDGSDAELDRVLRAFGVVTRAIDSTYALNTVRSGDDLDVCHVTTTGSDAKTCAAASQAKRIDITMGADEAWTGGSAPDGTPQLFITTNGDINVTELFGDLLAGHIHSTSGDVTLTSPRRVLDANGQSGDDVTGRNITMTVGTGGVVGGVGLPSDFLELNVDRNNGSAATLGVLNITDTATTTAPWNFTGFPPATTGYVGTYGVFVTETAGDLKLAVVRTGGDASLVTTGGSVVDARAEGAGVNTPLSTANVVANNVWIDANGGSIGTAPTGVATLPGGPDGLGNDLKIDSSNLVDGKVALEASNSIYVTEIDEELNLLLARALGGNVRLTVRDSAAQGEDLLLVQPTSKYLVVENAPTTVTNGLVNAAGWVLLRVGDNVTLDSTVGFTPAAPDAADPPLTTQITAGTWIDVYGDHGDLDPGWGSRIYLHSTLTSGTLTNTCEQSANPSTRTCNLIRFFGGADADTIYFDSTQLNGKTRAYGSAVPTPYGGTAPVCGTGRTCEDLFVVDHLQTMNAAAGHTLTLDGQESTDAYVVWTMGTSQADRHYVVNVLDTGAPDDGVDTLDVWGFDSPSNGLMPDGITPFPADDIFLLRSMSFIGSATAPATTNEVADRPGFVAVLHTTLPGARGTGSPYQSTGSYLVERVNYDAGLNGRLSVYGRGGNDYYAVDDVTVITTLDGGAGADQFQIGQLYGLTRDCLNTSGTAEAGCSVAAPTTRPIGATYGGSLAPQDVFQTIATTRGWLSPGTTAPLVAKGGSGDDQFTVYSNQAELRLEGDDDNDLFVVRAFALAQTTIGGANGGTACDTNAPSCQIVWINVADRIAMPRLTSGFSTAKETEIRTGGGVNQVEYNVNAPVSIDGGNGFDKVVILGTEFADHIVVTERTVYGAGLTVRYLNVEVLEIDTLEGDDTIDVLSTAPGVVTRVIGGLGSDVINVGGDVAGDVVSRDIEGTSGTISHLVTSEDGDYSGLPVDGVDVTVARPGQGQVIISESGGFTEIFESGCFSLTATTCLRAVDSYTVRLAEAPTSTVYVTVSGSLSPQQERSGSNAGDTMWLSGAGFGSAAAFQYAVTVDGQTKSVPRRGLVLTFTPGNWDAAQTVYLFAADDTRAEGDRVVTVNHSVISDDLGFHAAVVRNVEVMIRDNELADVHVVPVDTAGNPDGVTKVLEGASGVVDRYKIQLAIAPAAGKTVTVRITPALVDGNARVCLSSADSRFSAADGSCPSAGTTYTVTFSSADWNSPVYVGVAARNDFERQDPQNVALTHEVVTSASADPTYAAQTIIKRLDALVIDDENPGVFVRETDGRTLVTACGDATCSAPGPGDSYDLRLNRAPSAPVTIALITDGQTDIAGLGSGSLVTATAAGGRIVLQQVGGTRPQRLFSGNLTFLGTTVTRANGSDLGSFVADGFLVGQRIRISGGVYGVATEHTITSVTADSLVLATAPSASGTLTGVTLGVLVDKGIFTGAASYDHAAGTLTRADGRAWLDSGFIEGQLIRIGADNTLYKIESFSGANLQTLRLTSTAKPAMGSVPGTVTIAQWAAAATFDSTNWDEFVTIGVVADPDLQLSPGRANLRMFPKQPHTLSGIRGPLAVEGGTTSADRSLKGAIMLPGEVNGPLFQVAQQPPEQQQVDVLNVYADGSRQDLTGLLTSTAVTGLNMGSELDFRDLFGEDFVFPFGEPGVYPGGISYGTIRLNADGVFDQSRARSTIEVVNVLLGSGNDHLTVESTLVPGPDLGIVVEHATVTTTTITRPTGRTWTQDGFEAGQKVVVNDGEGLWTITGISADGLTMTLSGAALTPGTNATVTVGAVALHGGVTAVHG
ncbi:MAG: hypothetical protein ACRDPR_07925, partial [Nocardioidaceae bacterium]